MEKLILKREQPKLTIETDSGDLILTLKRVPISRATEFNKSIQKLSDRRELKEIDDFEYIRQFILALCDISDQAIFDDLDISFISEISEAVKKLQESVIKKPEKKSEESPTI